MINKRIGETPLAAMNAHMATLGLSDEKATYAGRLDPMARGKLLILSGDDRFNKDQYLGLSKTYMARILFGCDTDTWDILGMPTPHIASLNLNTFSAHELIGEHDLPLPAFSSIPINGTPSFTHARAGKLTNSTTNRRNMNIMHAELLGKMSIRAHDLLTYITTRVNCVIGDFRQDDILYSWQQILSGSDETYQAITIQLNVTSGTYIRSIANMIGEQLGARAILLDLHRTEIHLK